VSIDNCHGSRGPNADSFSTAGALSDGSDGPRQGTIPRGLPVRRGHAPFALMPRCYDTQFSQAPDSRSPAAGARPGRSTARRSASRTAASGRPTMVKLGNPLETWTSTATGRPTTPLSVAEATEASTQMNGRTNDANGRLSRRAASGASVSALRGALDESSARGRCLSVNGVGLGMQRHAWQLYAIFERLSTSSLARGRSKLVSGTSHKLIPSTSRDFTRALWSESLDRLAGLDLKAAGR
jgi:hypothetical protein